MLLESAERICQTLIGFENWADQEFRQSHMRLDIRLSTLMISVLVIDLTNSVSFFS